ncbi:hypothetical protein, partial [Bradyrhizobium guangdongense]|uniref:hypothetical protein n=1 Tax=Bradyrhizobium guangdongense TaxID=1325090 RepID=UPI001AECEFD9
GDVGLPISRETEHYAAEHDLHPECRRCGKNTSLKSRDGGGRSVLAADRPRVAGRNMDMAFLINTYGHSTNMDRTKVRCVASRKNH